VAPDGALWAGTNQQGDSGLGKIDNDGKNGRQYSARNGPTPKTAQWLWQSSQTAPLDRIVSVWRGRS